MRRVQPAARTATSTLEVQARSIPIAPPPEQQPPPPTPQPRLRATDRIREALQRWLEEDM